MLLRTRISLIVTLALLVICAGFVIAAIQREDIITTRFSEEIVSDRSVVWDRVIDQIVQRMEVDADTISDNEALISAVRRADAEAVRRIADGLNNWLWSTGVSSRLDIVASDGQLAYSSSSELFPSASVSAETIEQTRVFGQIVSGLSNDQQRNIVIAVGIPLHDGSGYAGLGIMSTSIDEAISEIETVTRSTVLLVNRRGRLLAGDADQLWHSIGSHVDLLRPNSLQTVHVDDKVYSAIVVPEEADLGTLRANLVSVRDVTEVAAQQDRLRNLMIWGTAIALGLVLVLLNLYMSWVFNPLAAGIDMLNALSLGNLSVRLDTGSNRDEVGRIAHALNIFRSRMLAMDRLRQSRERQRARQERFIRREMTDLAATLDEEERTAVIEELHHVEAMVQSREERSGNTFSRAARSLERFHEEGEQEQEASAVESEEGTERLIRNAELDGIAMMAIAFQKMSDRVQDQNQRLRDALATKNQLIAIQKELDIAAKVQLSLMPDPLPPSTLFSISGTMKPAKEVGGDFFDYFRIDEKRIAVVIADVSGKGVPAALFMVMARTVLRATIRGKKDSPGEVLKRVNDFLERNNAEQMFVTVFFGILDEMSGRFTFSNGGHNAPLLVRGGEAIPLQMTGGVILGMIDSLDYDEAHVDLQSGDRLVFVTDGISEAFNNDSEAYGDERLMDAAAEMVSHPTRRPDEDIAEIIGSVEDFVGDAPQFDDITCVVLHYGERGSPANEGDSGPTEAEQAAERESGSVLEVTVAARLDELERLAEIIDAHAEERDWPPGWSMNLNLCFDELITNVVNHGFSDHPDGVEAATSEIGITVTESGDDLVIEMTDRGIEFDPFVEAPEPDVDASVEERKIGGLGVHLVKHMMDEASWERRGDFNHIRLVKHGLNQHR